MSESEYLHSYQVQYLKTFMEYRRNEKAFTDALWESNEIFATDETGLPS